MEELCAVGWAFCMSGHYHDHLFQSVCRAARASISVASDFQCMLYEIHVALKAFRPDFYNRYALAGDTVRSLRSQYTKHRGGKGREAKLDRASEKTHRDIAEVLRSIVDDSVSRQHQLELGFVVDLAVVRRHHGASAVALVEVDGSHSSLRSLDPSALRLGRAACRVRSEVLFKRALLQKLGFQVAVVSEELWRSLADVRDKRDLLRDLLKTAGVAKDRLR